MTRRIVLVLALLSLALAGCGDAEVDPRVTRGERLLWSRGCLACHTLDGTPHVGPSLAEILQRQDEAYVLRALTEPDADLVEGFVAGTMPVYALTDDESGDLLAALAEVRVEQERSIVPLAFACLLLILGHLVMSARPIRNPMVERIGPNAWQGVYSLVAIGAMVWLAAAWTTAPFVPLWHTPAWTRWVPLLGMPVVMVFLVAGYTTPSPAIATMEDVMNQPNAVRGIVKVTRHPANLSMAAWGALHLVANGDLRSVVVMGSVVLLGVVGSVHIDLRRRKDYGAAWLRFEEATSFVPFAAILRGRQRVTLGEIGWWRILAGLAGFGAWLYLHGWVIGADVWPF